MSTEGYRVGSLCCGVFVVGVVVCVWGVRVMRG